MAAGAKIPANRNTASSAELPLNDRPSPRGCGVPPQAVTVASRRDSPPSFQLHVCGGAGPFFTRCALMHVNGNFDALMRKVVVEVEVEAKDDPW